nr:polysaccharide biosynthesis C-terminal domain-containing protein [Gammaproteobacteria bacterium]
GGITQINLIIGQIIASAQDGAIAVLSYADRIYQLPLGVIGIAIGIVLLPELSRALKSASQSPEHAESDNVHSLQNQSLEFAMALTLPAAVGLALLPDAIINVIYERGAFTADITALTADVLYAFAWGLPAFVLIKVFTPAFFAREDMRTPMWFAGVSVVVNIAGSLWLFPHYGPVGIAIATAVASWVNAIALATTLARRSMLSVLPSTLRRLMLIVFASAIMALSLLGLSAALSEWFTAPTLIVRAGTLGASIAIAASVFFATALATGAIDRNAITSAIVRSSKPRPD